MALQAAYLQTTGFLQAAKMPQKYLGGLLGRDPTLKDVEAAAAFFLKLSAERQIEYLPKALQVEIQAFDETLLNIYAKFLLLPDNNAINQNDIKVARTESGLTSSETAMSAADAAKGQPAILVGGGSQRSSDNNIEPTK